MQETVSWGPLIGGLFWLIAIPLAFILVMRWHKNQTTETKKESLSDLQTKLMKEMSESYNKLTPEQKRKIDSIK